MAKLSGRSRCANRCVSTVTGEGFRRFEFSGNGRPQRLRVFTARYDDCKD